MPVAVYAEAPGLEDFIRHLDDLPYRNRVVHNVMRAFCAEVARLSVRKVRKRTRATAQSVAFRAYESPLWAIIAVHNLTGLLLEKGTRAHQINARQARALMLPVRPGMGRQTSAMGFEVTSPFGRSYGRAGTSRLTGKVRSGQIAFYRSVQHPGTVPMPFLVPALHESLPVLDLLLLKAGAQIVRRMAGRGELAGI